MSDKPTREHLIDVALELFVDNGYHGTSMRNIADTAGISTSGTYNHFSNKEALFVAIIRRWHPFVQIQPLLEKVTGVTVQSRLNNTLRRVIEIYDTTPKLHHLLFIELLEFDAKHLPSLFEELKPTISLWMQALIEADGELRVNSELLLFQWMMSVLYAYFSAKYIMGVDVNLDQFMALYINGVVK